MKTYSMKIHRQIKAVPVFQTLNFFYLFAVLGWLWEFCLRYHMTGKIAKWGVLHGTWAPIYGAGAVLTILLAKLLARYPVRLFVGSMMICTLVEYKQAVCWRWLMGGNGGITAIGSFSK